MGKKRTAVYGFIILLALSACGRQEAQSLSGGADSVGAAESGAYWTDSQWIYNGGINGDISYNKVRPLYLVEEVGGLDARPDRVYDEYSTYSCAIGNTVYSLNSFSSADARGEHCYYINRYEGMEGEIAHWPVELPAPEEYGAEEFHVASMDGKKEGELVLFLQGMQDGGSRMACYLAVHMTLEGEALSVADLYPALEELGMELETAVSFEDACVDGAGYYYLIPWKADQSRGSDVYVLDPEGRTVGRMSPGEEYKRAEYAMKLPDGSAVFSWAGRGETILLGTYDREKNTMQTLMEERLAGAWLWTSARDGYLYYVSGAGELIRCDIRTGALEDCLYFPQLGLEENRRLTRIVVGAGGEPEILGRKNGETVLCRLGTEAPDTGEARLVSLSPSCDILRDCVASFSQEHPDHPVRLECCESWSQADAYRDRALADLVSGQGADLYYVHTSDMRILQEKGVLADLRELVSEETLSALWPGILQAGTLNGQLVAITPEAGASTMLVSDELWPEDHWTLEEALEVMEAHPKLQYPVMSNSMLDKEYVFSFLVLQNLSESPFLDLEGGVL